MKQNGATVHRKAPTFDRTQAVHAWLANRENQLQPPGGLARRDDVTPGKAAARDKRQSHVNCGAAVATIIFPVRYGVSELRPMALIDVHQHVIPDFYKQELAKVGILGSGENPWPAWSTQRQLELMDEFGIDAVLLSIASPGAFFGEIELTRRLVRGCNEVMARIVADHPRKFGAMAFVSLPDVASACKDVEYALDELELDGINLQSHTGERYLGHPDENELYGELDRRRALVFVHPQRPPVRNMPSYSFPAGYTELTFDTTRAITNMLYNGTFARYPNIRWIMPHMGGVTPFLLFRLSGLDDDPQVRKRSPDGVAAYLARLYYDIAQSASPLALRALLEIADPARVLFGTDYPSARNVEKVMRDTIAALRAFDGFDEVTRRNVMGGNAAALLPRFAALA